MRYRVTAALLFCGLVLGAAPAQGQQDLEREKLAQTGMKFLTVSVDPRAAAMGNAMTAVEGASMALFQNPASMAWQQTAFNAGFGYATWLADINYNQASLSFQPAAGRYGIFGLSLLFVDYGDLQGTVRADNEDGFVDTGNFSPSALSVGFGYAKVLTDRFSVGGQVKLAYQDLGNSVDRVDEGGNFVNVTNDMSVLAFDFGVFYRTGFRSLNFAVSARNFAQEITFEEESFQLPLTLRLGVSMNLMDLVESASQTHAFLLAIDAETPRDFSEQIRIGGEYTFLNTIALRAGYVFPTDEQGISLGVGFQQTLGGVGFSADYAYTDYGAFNSFSSLGGVNGIHRLALQLSL
jgi:hypothetical protein